MNEVVPVLDIDTFEELLVAPSLTFAKLRDDIIEKMDKEDIQGTARDLVLSQIDRDQAAGETPEEIWESVLRQWNQVLYINQTF